MLLPHEDLHPFLDPSESSADLLCGLAPPFQLDAECLKVLIEVLHPVSLQCPRVALTPERLPKHHSPRQALFSHACHEAREQYPSSVCRLNALGVCPEKHVGCSTSVQGILANEWGPTPNSISGERGKEPSRSPIWRGIAKTWKSQYDTAPNCA